jgi:hypothetical protein
VHISKLLLSMIIIAIKGFELLTTPIENFYYGMLAEDVNNLSATLMYFVVAAFGPQWKLIVKKAFVNSCTVNPDGEKVCSIVPTRTIVPTSQEAVNLSDPETRDLALRKLAAIQKTINATKGSYFELVSAGPLPSELDAIEKSAALTRKIFLEGKHLTNPSLLGIIDANPPNMTADWKSLVWEGKTLPRYAGREIKGSKDAVIKMLPGGWGAPAFDALQKDATGVWQLMKQPDNFSAAGWKELQLDNSEAELKSQKELYELFVSD